MSEFGCGDVYSCVDVLRDKVMLYISFVIFGFREFLAAYGKQRRKKGYLSIRPEFRVCD